MHVDLGLNENESLWIAGGVGCVCHLCRVIVLLDPVVSQDFHRISSVPG